MFLNKTDCSGVFILTLSLLSHLPLIYILNDCILGLSPFPACHRVSLVVLEMLDPKEKLAQV